MVVFGGLDSDDVPLSRLYTATVMVCRMGGRRGKGKVGGGGCAWVIACIYFGDPAGSPV